MFGLNKKNKTKKCVWASTLPAGTLVRPVKKLFLTPLRDEEIHDWTQWDHDELGIVLPSTIENTGILVLAPKGIGFCFADEVKEIQSLM